MTENQYNIMADRIRDIPGLVPAILFLNRILTALGFLAYPFLLLTIGLGTDPTGEKVCLLLWYIAGPAVCFVLLSFYRKKKNVERPYQAMDIRPLIQKDTSGQSFPSRHIFSLAMIALLWYPFCIPVSFILILSCFLLSAIRVIGGVHYIRDVLVGGLIGFLCGILIDLVPFLLNL